jgi:hypothetical protein
VSANAGIIFDLHGNVGLFAQTNAGVGILLQSDLVFVAGGAGVGAGGCLTCDRAEDFWETERGATAGGFFNGKGRGVSVDINMSTGKTDRGSTELIVSGGAGVADVVGVGNALFLEFQVVGVGGYIYQPDDEEERTRDNARRRRQREFYSPRPSRQLRDNLIQTLNQSTEGLPGAARRSIRKSIREQLNSPEFERIYKNVLSQSGQPNEVEIR